MLQSTGFDSQMERSGSFVEFACSPDIDMGLLWESKNMPTSTQRGPDHPIWGWNPRPCALHKVFTREFITQVTWDVMNPPSVRNFKLQGALVLYYYCCDSQKKPLAHK